jgi:hypothetical protein
MSDGFCDRCLEQHRLDIKSLEHECTTLRAKLKLEIENNIAVGGLLKQLEEERQKTIEVLERTLIAAGVPLPGVPK